MNSTKPLIELDGQRIRSLEEFYDEVSRAFAPGASWGRNLDAFDDLLRGGFGTPAGGFTIFWKCASLSRVNLGYPETERWILAALKVCHPSNVGFFMERLERVKHAEGPTLFDDLVAIIKKHGTGGTEAKDGVELVLG